MKVHSLRQLCGCLSYPAVILIYACLYTHEVDAWQFHGVSVGIDRPVDFERIQIGKIVGMVVDIAPCEGIQHIIGAVAARIDTVARQEPVKL